MSAAPSRPPRVVAVSVGLPRARGTEGAQEPMDRPWTSGIVKDRVRGPVRVSRTNLAGDGQADLTVHGGPDKAVLAYAAAHYPGWREALGIAELAPGGFGENLTVEGLDEESVCLGDVWRVGGAVLEVSQPRQPCWKLARRWRIPDLALRVQESGRGGWYLRVLTEGDVSEGDAVERLRRPLPQWTIARLNDAMHVRKDDLALARELADLEPLAESWRRAFGKRAAGAPPPDARKRTEGPGAA